MPLDRAMLLALSVISSNAASMGPTAYKVFESNGGSIGRLESNDWTLPDPDKFVSSRHALLVCEGGGFYLEDKSTNGTFINGHDRRVPQNERVLLKDGDRIFIGDYEILVQLIDDGPPASPAPAPLPAQRAPAQPLGGMAEEVAPALSGETVDPLALIMGGAEYSPPAPEPPAAAPQPAASAQQIPNDWRTVLPSAAPARPLPAAAPPQPTASEAQLSARTAAWSAPPPVMATSQAPAAAAAPPTGGALDLLNALGLDPARVQPAIYEQLGLIMRIVVQGMIEVLQSRADVKNNFRMPMTSIRPVENNPLKFSLNAEDALHNLFVKHNPGYLGPRESFEEGFQDLAFHQMAMVAGIRAA